MAKKTQRAREQNKRIHNDFVYVRISRGKKNKKNQTKQQCEICISYEQIEVRKISYSHTRWKSMCKIKRYKHTSHAYKTNVSAQKLPHIRRKHRGITIQSSTSAVEKPSGKTHYAICMHSWTKNEKHLQNRTKTKHKQSIAHRISGTNETQTHTHVEPNFISNAE